VARGRADIQLSRNQVNLGGRTLRLKLCGPSVVDIGPMAQRYMQSLIHRVDPLIWPHYYRTRDAMFEAPTWPLCRHASRGRSRSDTQNELCSVMSLLPAASSMRQPCWCIPGTAWSSMDLCSSIHLSSYSRLPS